MKKTLCLLLTALFLFGLAAGCKSSGTTDTGTDTGTQTPSTDTTQSSDTSGLKVINYANGAQPEAMDLINSNYAKTSIVMYNIYCGLTHIGSSGKAELACAESYTTSDDGLVWTFKLRPDLKWSNGETLTAHDWEDTIEYELNPTTNTRSWELKKYIKNSEEYNAGTCTWADVGCKALDDNTIEFTLTAPCPYFLDLCCTYVPMYLKSIHADPNWAKNAETYVTNGAFRVTKIAEQVGFYTEKNPNYWNAENVKIDQVNFMWIDDEAVELSSYQNGTINVSDNLSAEANKQYAGTADYHAAERIGVKYLTFNTAHITDKLIRQAMSYAVDREMLIKILGYAYKPADGLVPYGIHWGDKQWRDVANEKNGAPLAGYDLEKAKALLAQAGYPNGEGLPKYTYICYNSETQRAQALQQMWQQIGINIEIVPYESSTYWDVFDTENWDIGDDGWTGDYDDPNTNLFLWEEYREVNDDGTLKDARWHDDAALQYDALMKKTYTETDYETRMDLFRQAEQVIVEDMPVIPVFYYTDTILIKPNITGVVKCYIGHVFFEYADING